MKLYLASYLEPKNHGSGKKYAIATTKPENLTVDGAYKYFIPTQELMDSYKEKQLDDQIEAAKYFNETFRSQLDNFRAEVVAAAALENKQPTELLPFEEGDVFLSWEMEGYTSYRPLVAECLTQLGYEVILK